MQIRAPICKHCQYAHGVFSYSDILRFIAPGTSVFEIMLKSIEGCSSSPVASKADRGQRQNSSRNPNSGGSLSNNYGHDGGQRSNSYGNDGGQCSRGRGQCYDYRGNSHGGSSNSNGRRPYTARYQIYRGEHYVDKCPQFLNACNASSSAQLAQAFSASCNVSDHISNWYLDSVASAHMTSQTSGLDTFESYTGNGAVIIGNVDLLNISHTGSSKLSKDVHLLDILVIPPHH